MWVLTLRTSGSNPPAQVLRIGRPPWSSIMQKRPEHSITASHGWEIDEKEYYVKKKNARKNRSKTIVLNPDDDRASCQA